MKKCQKLDLNAYVCEDMSKCICLYNAPDEEAVRRAKQLIHRLMASKTLIRQQVDDIYVYRFGVDFDCS